MNTFQRSITTQNFSTLLLAVLVYVASTWGVPHESCIGVINRSNPRSSKARPSLMVYLHCSMETHEMANQNVSELTCAQIHCWQWQCATSGVSSYRLPVSRMRETLIDEQGSPQPSETFLLLTPGVTDPSFITISIMSAPREKQDTEFHLEQQRKMLSRNFNAWTARHDIALSQPCYCTLHMMLFKGFASLSYYASKCSTVDSSWRFYIPLIFHKKRCHLSIANAARTYKRTSLHCIVDALN